MIPGYTLRTGSRLDRARLLKFMQLTYQEICPDGDFSHLAQTVEQYFGSNTPLWWVEATSPSQKVPVGCLWLGSAIDQVSGDRHAHIFLVYVAPEHRRRGIGSALMQHAETWAKDRGDRQIGLQVFLTNQPALNLYRKLGYDTQSLWMLKPLKPRSDR
nr:GNAT family N-acetyltransferase [Oscillatoria sp. PCC 10802]